ncbi:MAG: hypothetical protein HY287_05745 [Planctomycetes bacterium]|nr:hypothetical protein [Planctomycetota bacterium]MBI3833814.1 hypothetical protein [Planctomycetota bacterium]
MMIHCSARLATTHLRRGVVAVFTLVMLVVLLGFAALTVDVGAMYNTRADLQNAADAAAISGAQMYFSAEMSKVRNTSGTSDFGPVASLINKQVKKVSGMNYLYGAKTAKVEGADIVSGYLDLKDSKSTITTGASPKTHNAVSVLLRRDKESANGALPLTFSGIFGKTYANVSASAVAVLDDHVKGYDPGVEMSAVLWPITIHISEWNYWLSLALDNYNYDPDDESVSKGSDSFDEVRLYPAKLAPGNFGLLNIGNPSGSGSDIATQINNGITEADLQKTLGTPTANFLDDNGKAVTYNIPGNTGLKSSLQTNINAHIGDIVGIFIHDQVSGSGANAIYHEVAVKFVRVLNVNLSGGANKALWVEPITYTGPGIITNPGAPSSSGAAGVVRLAR